MPEEKLPDATPPAAFFMPNFLGIAFAVGLEKIDMESRLMAMMMGGDGDGTKPATVHPCAFMGLAVFCLFMMNSFLAGRVVNARVEYGVKLPNLVRDTRDQSFCGPCSNPTLSRVL
jgi:hypothetical protein